MQGVLHITVIYVTHDQTEALVMSDRIAVFNHGRIEQLGTPEDLYDRPANHFVAAFLGESNFLTAVVLSGDGPYCAVQLNDGARLRVLAGGDERAGEQVTVAVRPEKVLLGADAAGLPNAVPAVVREVIFVGEVRRYEVALPTGEVLVVKQTNRQGLHGSARGEEVMVGWHDQDSRIVGRQE
jgi:ABC-type Fe3+/spermidine/putrescine transport system ATPase subunit